jgi:hypothetical protein
MSPSHAPMALARPASAIAASQVRDDLDARIDMTLLQGLRLLSSPVDVPARSFTLPVQRGACHDIACRASARVSRSTSADPEMELSRRSRSPSSGSSPSRRRSAPALLAVVEEVDLHP